MSRSHVEGYPPGEARDDDQAGQGMVEYAFILVLVVLVVLLMVVVLGGQTKNMYSNVQSALPGSP